MLKDVWEKYRIKFIKGGHVFWKEHWALRGVDFTLQEHETVGILGRNGAGKTTLLKVIAGIFAPDKGIREVRGRIASLFDLGAGLSPELSGTENIIHNIRSYGIEKERIEQKIQEIAYFSQIGEFIDAPLKYYSSGMYARLAFALALSVEPDIFLIDDILSVGDTFFQERSLKRVRALKNQGCSVAVVSHDIKMLRGLCDRAVIVDEGRISFDGDTEQGTTFYLAQRVGDASGQEEEAQKEKKQEFREVSQTLRLRALPEKGILFAVDIKTASRENNFHGIFVKEGDMYRLCFLENPLRFGMVQRSDQAQIQCALVSDQELVQVHRLMCFFTLANEDSSIEELWAGNDRIDLREGVEGPLQLHEQSLDELCLKLQAGHLVFKITEGFYSVFIKDRTLHITVVKMRSHCSAGEEFLKWTIQYQPSYTPPKKILTPVVVGASLRVEQTGEKIDLSMKGERITSGLGAYFSLKRDGVWFDSCQSQIRIVQKGKNFLEIEREWYLFNIRQKESYTVEGGRLSGQVTVQAAAPLTDCLIFHYACMLNPEYTAYTFDKCSGIFRDEFSSKYAYSPYIYFNLPANGPLVLSGGNIPAVAIETSAGGYNCVLENSDVFYKSRVVKFEQVPDSGIFTRADIGFSLTVR